MEQFENNQNQENINETNSAPEAEVVQDTVEVVAQPADEKEPRNIKKEIIDWTASILIAVIVALVIRTYIFTLVKVDGESMVPTLSHGDTLYANRFMYTPDCGDIIVFRPPNSPKTPYIKRVIATEGQTVNIDEQCNVYVDDVLLEEDYINGKMLSSGGMQYPCTVPEGHIFVMGDNRNNSLDSRSVNVGFVPVDNVIGHAIFRLMPLNHIGVVR